MRPSVNLALLKPATQSSICEYSRGATVEADAAFATNGDLDPSIAFCTAREASPWWEVDLVEICTLERVYIKNRREENQRFCNFTILYSRDHGHWETAFVKCDPRQFLDIEIPLYNAVDCRYLRIRLDGEDFLHLSQVEVYGWPRLEFLGARTRVAENASVARPITVFSVLFNEGYEFLNALIDNLLHFTSDSEHFVINVTSSISLDIAFPKDRIYFIRGKKRSDVGPTLLLGHLETIRWTRENLPPFDYFVPMSSNSLFIRKFEPEIALQRLHAGAGAEWYLQPNMILSSAQEVFLENHEWWWPWVERQAAFLRFVRDTIQTDTLVPMQIEGLMAPAVQWIALGELAPAIEATAEAMDSDREALFPMEEVLPATFFAARYGRNFTSICQVLWHPFRTMVRVDQIIEPAWHFPQHIFIAKWFDRGIDVPATAAVTTSRGRQLVQLISQSLNTDSLDEVSGLYDMMRALADSLDVLVIKRRGYRINIETSSAGLSAFSVTPIRAGSPRRYPLTQ